MGNESNRLRPCPRSPGARRDGGSARRAHALSSGRAPNHEVTVEVARGPNLLRREILAEANDEPTSRETAGCTWRRSIRYPAIIVIQNVASITETLPKAREDAFKNAGFPKRRPGSIVRTSPGGRHEGLGFIWNVRACASVRARPGVQWLGRQWRRWFRGCGRLGWSGWLGGFRGFRG